MPSSPGQHPIDYTRSEQLAILAECVIPPQYVVEGKRTIRVSPVNMKAVLKALDNLNRGSGEAWPSFPTLAQHSGLSRRNAVRAVRAIEQLSLITKVRKVGRNAGGNGKPVNHYRIVWSELNLLRPKCHRGTLEDESKVPPAQSKVPPAQSKVPPVAYEPYEAFRNVTPTTSPATNSAPSRTASWKLAVAELERLRIREVRRIISRRQYAGEDPDKFLARVVWAQRTLAVPANRAKFGNPVGALVYFLEQGDWPTSEKLVDPDAPVRRRPPPEPEPEKEPVDPKRLIAFYTERAQRKRLSAEATEQLIRTRLAESGFIYEEVRFL
jgi:hypothetical protein